MPIYAPSFNTTSARAQKTAIDPVSPPDVLERVEALDVSTWEFDHQDDGRHIGPMAEDFAEQFALGNDEHIATVDADGVAFAAIQALADKDAEREREAEQLRAELDDKDDRIDELEAEAAELREENDALTARLAAVEARLDSADTD
jgi:peptidoglycan hydrolase CwlO-like protein